MIIRITYTDNAGIKRETTMKGVTDELLLKLMDNMDIQKIDILGY